jgi:protein TonB
VERPAPPARPPEPQPAAPEKAEVKPPPAIPPPAPTPPAAPAAKVEPPPAPRSGTSEPTQESAPPGAGGREAKAPPLPAESAPASKPPPQVASLPALPPVELPRTAAPEVTQRVPRPAGPETALVSPPAAPPLPGLSLGGASKELGPPAPGAAGSPARPARPSLRDQIASLGSGEWAEGQGSAKQTIDLDNREPHYVDYLALLKRRIERVWGYPPEAANSGISGDLLLIFTLNKSGSLIDLRLIRSSGFPVLDEAAIRAVKLAAPYDPFPPYMGTDPWNIRASFTYYLPYGFRRY